MNSKDHNYYECFTRFLSLIIQQDNFDGKKFTRNTTTFVKLFMTISDEMSFPPAKVKEIPIHRIIGISFIEQFYRHKDQDNNTNNCYTKSKLNRPCQTRFKKGGLSFNNSVHQDKFKTDPELTQGKTMRKCNKAVRAGYYYIISSIASCLVTTMQETIRKFLRMTK